MNIKRIIPDMITSCNLLCGAVAVMMAVQGHFSYALLFIIAGALFDFGDGASARLLKVSNEIGIQLDSLADDITFGLAPAMMVCCYLKPMIGWWAVIALLMAPFAAIRLAKFNLDKRQTSSFIGLATPPNAVFWGSLCCLPVGMMEHSCLPWVMLAMTLVSDYLLISEIPFFSLKFHDLHWRGNEDKWLLLIGMVIILVFAIAKAICYGHWELALLAGASCVIWYFVLNIISQLVHRHQA